MSRSLNVGLSALRTARASRSAVSALPALPVLLGRRPLSSSSFRAFATHSPSPIPGPGAGLDASAAGSRHAHETESGGGADLEQYKDYSKGPSALDKAAQMLFMTEILRGESEVA